MNDDDTIIKQSISGRSVAPLPRSRADRGLSFLSHRPLAFDAPDTYEDLEAATYPAQDAPSAEWRAP
jgi:hypothetical protein